MMWTMREFSITIMFAQFAPMLPVVVNDFPAGPLYSSKCLYTKEFALVETLRELVYRGAEFLDV